MKVIGREDWSHNVKNEKKPSIARTCRRGMELIDSDFSRHINFRYPPRHESQNQFSSRGLIDHFVFALGQIRVESLVMLHFILGIGGLLGLVIIWVLIFRAAMKKPNLDEGGHQTETYGGGSS